MTASDGFEVDFKPGVSGQTRLYIGQYQLEPDQDDDGLSDDRELVLHRT
jgi:hypothetical protein